MLTNDSRVVYPVGRAQHSHHVYRARPNDAGPTDGPAFVMPGQAIGGA